MILTPEQIRIRLKSLGVGPDKFLGQHFLIDQTVLDDMLSYLETQGAETHKQIVEVGPGLGVLTRSLTDAGYFVVAIERDPVFAQRLEEVVPAKDRLAVIQGDVLTVIDHNKTFPYDINFRETFYTCVSEYTKYIHLQAPRFGWSVVANIPYAITSPLLRKLVALQNPPEHILVLVQKEAAERIVAEPGDSQRGLLSVLIQMEAEARIVRLVPPRAFWPQPEVESAVLHVKLRAKPLVPAEEMDVVTRMVIAGFSQKRKQLANSLAGGLGIKPTQARELLEKAGIDPLRRAETLTLEEWQSLTRAQREISVL